MTSIPLFIGLNAADAGATLFLVDARSGIELNWYSTLLSISPSLIIVTKVLLAVLILIVLTKTNKLKLIKYVNPVLALIVLLNIMSIGAYFAGYVA